MKREKFEPYQKAVLLKNGTKLYILGEQNHPQDGHTIMVRKITADAHCTFRVKPNDIAYIE